MTTTPFQLLQDYRARATPVLREQAKLFRALSPADQREFLFYSAVNMAVAQVSAAEKEAAQ